jgi:hypothetical protein
MFPDWVDYGLVSGIAAAFVYVVGKKVKEFKDGIAASRKRIEKRENKIEWL